MIGFDVMIVYSARCIRTNLIEEKHDKVFTSSILKKERRKGSRKEKMFVRSLMVVLTRKEREGEN